MQKRILLQLLQGQALRLSSGRAMISAACLSRANPPAGASGKHSYTIRFDENAIAIDVLCNKRAFYVKKPEKHKGQWTWNSFDSISACLKDLLRRCREDVSRPTVRELS